MAKILNELQNFYVVQTQGAFHNELGEMTEMQVYAHLRTRLGDNMAAAESVLSELQEKGAATVRFKALGGETTIEIRRLTPNETVYGHGTHVPCGQCGRRIFLEGPVEVELRDGGRWVKLQCNSPSCVVSKQPCWYPEVALEIHGNR